MSIRYSPPTTEDLRALKDRLGYTSEQMADLFGLAGNNQWRKYTGGVEPRQMSLPMLFLAAALLLGPEATIREAFDWCRKVGAAIDLDSTGDSSQQD